MVHQAILMNESLPRVESLSPLMHNDQVEGAGNINLRALRNEMKNNELQLFGNENKYSTKPQIKNVLPLSCVTRFILACFCSWLPTYLL